MSLTNVQRTRYTKFGAVLHKIILKLRTFVDIFIYYLAMIQKALNAVGFEVKWLGGLKNLMYTFIDSIVLLSF